MSPEMIITLIAGAGTALLFLALIVLRVRRWRRDLSDPDKNYYNRW